MARDVGEQGDTYVHAIAQMTTLSPDQLQILKSHWLTSVEALVAAVATSEGRSGLEQAIGSQPKAFDEILQEARDMLGEDRYRELLAPCAGGATGALWEDPDGHPGAGRAPEEGHG